MTLTIFLKNGNKFTVPVTENQYGLFERAFLGRDGFNVDRLTFVTPHDTHGVIFSEMTHWKLSK